MKRVIHVAQNVHLVFGCQHFLCNIQQCASVVGQFVLNSDA
jgi:hypothetical protein